MTIERKRQPRENETMQPSEQKIIGATYQPIRSTNTDTENKLDLILNKMKEMEQDIKSLKETQSRHSPSHNEFRRGRGNYHRSDRRNWRRSGYGNRDQEYMQENSQESHQQEGLN